MQNYRTGTFVSVMSEAKISSTLLQNPGPLLSRLVAAQRLEEEAVQYPQIEKWADALISCANQLPGCLIWPVGAPAERIAGVAVARARGLVDVGLWNASIEGRTVLVFAVAGVTPLSVMLAAEQLRRRGAGDVQACGVAISGLAEAEGIHLFRLIADDLAAHPVSPVAA
jgi:hypothetical protein